MFSRILGVPAILLSVRIIFMDSPWPTLRSDDSLADAFYPTSWRASPSPSSRLRLVARFPLCSFFPAVPEVSHGRADFTNQVLRRRRADKRSSIRRKRLESQPFAPVPRLPRRTVAAAPVHLMKTQSNASLKCRKRPLAGLAEEAVLHRVENGCNPCARHSRDRLGSYVPSTGAAKCRVRPDASSLRSAVRPAETIWRNAS